MKRTQKTLAAAMFLAAALPVAAQESFEPAAEAQPAKPLNLCDYGAVREVAKVDRELKPVKDVVGIVTNPEGFVLHEVDQYVVHIPAWVGYALNPKGAVRAKLIDMARTEVKKSVGLESECRTAPAPVEAPAEAA
jgi:hypothetical protein